MTISALFTLPTDEIQRRNYVDYKHNHSEFTKFQNNQSESTTQTWVALMWSLKCFHASFHTLYCNQDTGCAQIRQDNKILTRTYNQS